MNNSIFDKLKHAEQGAKLSILSYLLLTILKKYSKLARLFYLSS